jgi:protein gp37
MGETTSIAWTEATWNPWHGCHKVSPECGNCYMFTEKKMYGQNGDIVVRSRTKFTEPLKWVRSGNPPHMCFTCSWSDWFIGEADPWRSEAWDVIRRTPKITYQILTKRAGRILSHLPGDWGEGWPNVWLGVSVGGRAQLPRIDTLRRVPSKVRFVSFEPLLEEVIPNLDGIHWAIVGGESGPKARPFNIYWFDAIAEACKRYGTKLFMKQIGKKPNANGLTVIAKGKGENPDEWPEYMRIREYPLDTTKPEQLSLNGGDDRG